MGWAADSDHALGTEAVAELETLCREVSLRFPRGVFFAGKLIFRHEGWWQRLLHNETGARGAAPARVRRSDDGRVADQDAQVNPYRPLHVARDEPPERADPELRGLAVVLVVLGVLRVIPALVDGKLDLETVIAIAMLAVGLGAVFDVHRWVRRWRLQLRSARAEAPSWTAYKSARRITRTR